MSRLFGGASTTDRLSSGSAGAWGASAAPWSVGMWTKVTTYATGRTFVAGGTTQSTAQGLQSGASTAQRFGCIWINTTTTMRFEVTAGSTGVWQCVVAVLTDNITASNNKMYLGAPATPMATATHQVDTNGVGTSSSSGQVQIGKSGTATTGINAAIMAAFVVPWAMTADEVERYRQGDLSVLWRGGLPSFMVPMFGGSAALRDMGNTVQNLTSTGAPADGEDPPISFGFGRAEPIHAQRRPTIQTSSSPSGGLTPAGTLSRGTIHAVSLSGAFT